MTTIHLDGVVGWDIEASEFAKQVDSVTGDIVFELNSGGGYVTDGVAILNKIRSYDRGTTTANISYAASMMTQIALACDKVKVYDNAIFMIHNVQGIVYGDHNDMREAADIQERMSGMLAQMYCKKTSKSKEEIKAMMDSDTYLFGNEIVEMGFADEIISTEKQSDKTAQMQTAKVMLEKVQKAMTQEKLSVTQLKEQFKQCVGNCDMGGSNTAVPVASGTKVAENSNTGANMEFNQENFNILLESREHLNGNIAVLNTQLSESATALEAAQSELATANSALAEATAMQEDVETRVMEAISVGVDGKTATAMLKAENAEMASKIANDFRASQGASAKADADLKAEADAWAEFKK